MHPGRPCAADRRQRQPLTLRPFAALPATGQEPAAHLLALLGAAGLRGVRLDPEHPRRLAGLPSGWTGTASTTPTSSHAERVHLWATAQAASHAAGSMLVQFEADPAGRWLARIGPHSFMTVRAWAALALVAGTERGPPA